MPRLWYPELYHVEVVCHKLAGNIFTYEPLPAFRLDGGNSGKLEAALALPRQGFGGHYFYPSWDRKAAILLRSIIKDHPLIDGNKRLGMTTTILFLMMNGRFLYVGNEDLVEYALSIARTKGTPPLGPISRWIRQNTVQFAKVNRIIDARIKKSPKLREQLEQHREAIRAFANWSRVYRQLERDLKRKCRREGMDPDEVARIFAEEVVEMSVAD